MIYWIGIFDADMKITATYDSHGGKKNEKLIGILAVVALFNVAGCATHGDEALTQKKT